MANSTGGTSSISRAFVSRFSEVRSNRPGFCQASHYPCSCGIPLGFPSYSCLPASTTVIFAIDVPGDARVAIGMKRSSEALAFACRLNRFLRPACNRLLLFPDVLPSTVSA